MTETTSLVRQIWAPALLSALGVALCWAAPVGAPALGWLAGGLLLAGAVVGFRQPAVGWRGWALVGLGGGLLGLALWWAQLQSIQHGWRGFQHLSELPVGALLHLPSGWLAVFAVLLWGQRSMAAWHVWQPKLGVRLGWLVGLAAAAAGAAALVGIPSLAVGLATLLFLLCLELYVEGDRTSLTWLLFWLLFFAALGAVWGFSRGLDIDRQQRQALLHEVRAQRLALDALPDVYYARSWPADSLRTRRPEALALAVGASLELLDRQRAVSILRADTDTWLVVGRFTGGYQPPVALFSFLFLGGLLLALALRALAWLSRAELAQWSVPLFGPSSLRLRIQLAFLGLTLAAFGLIGVFTVQFFQHSGGPVYEWLEQLLSVYVFLLLVAAVLGIALANSIANPIVGIGQRLRATGLQANEPLAWGRQDEIGRLVNSYNGMIAQLEESAARLAASEREGAWREMAKQVAHEIKNPLTPMKLHLQQWQRLQQDDPTRAAHWAARIAPALIEQIDSLAHIADEFSRFAQLPPPDPQVFDLRALLQNVADLHAHNAEGVDVTSLLPPEPALVYADRDHLQRVCTNLLRNAIQAIPDDRPGRVRVSLTRRASLLHIGVFDNGHGIPTPLRDKLFQPNFTTKTSGMGLGLAMCRRMVEQAGGSIGFHSEPGQETEFWVELPIYTSP